MDKLRIGVIGFGTVGAGVVETVYKNAGLMARRTGIEPVITDPVADADEARHLYGVEFVDLDAVRDMDAVILAVAHSAFLGFSVELVDQFFSEGKKVLLDIKGLLERKEYEAAGYQYWRL